MILKIIGIIFILSSCSLMGIYFSLKESYRISDLLEMKKALTILKSEIEYAENTLPEAFSNVSSRTAKEIGNFFDEMSLKLSSKNGGDLFFIWKETLKEGLKESHLATQDLESLEQLGRTLGYLDKNLQLNSIDLAAQSIDDRLRQLETVSEKNKKMYRSVGVISGLMISIVLF